VKRRAPAMPDWMRNLRIAGYDPYRDAGNAWQFVPSAALDAIEYIETQCHHAKEFRGLIKMEPWQRIWVANLMGWYSTTPDPLTGDHVRRYREVFLYVPRKNAKTTIIDALLAYIAETTTTHAEEIYCIATDEEQSGITYGILEGFVNQNDGMKDVFTLHHTDKRLTHSRTGAKIECLSGEVGKKHGMNPSIIYADEIHAMPNSQQWDVMLTGMAARGNPLKLISTTADTDRKSLCNDMLEYARKNRDGSIRDARHLPLIWELLPDEDWTLPANWQKVNPNYGVSVREDYMIEQYNRAVAEPSRQGEFRRLHLNQRTSTLQRWLSVSAWDRCAAAPVEDGPCYLGLDGGVTDDHTVVACWWPRTSSVRLWYWCPRETASGEAGMQDQYNDWARAGHIRLMDHAGDVNDDVVETIEDIHERYAPVATGYDRAFMSGVAGDLARRDIGLVTVKQNHIQLNGASRQFEMLVQTGQLRHGGHPILAWNASNCEYDIRHEMLMPKRPRGRHLKIDGIAAILTAMATAEMNPADEPGEPSVYIIGGLTNDWHDWRS